MLKNTASQVIGAQMVSAADGSAFTGSVTVYVTGNGGTQALGSVGSGACTHEGNGLHTYAPAQAETNYDHVAYTFIGSGAIPVTVQAYPITLADYKATGFSTHSADDVRTAILDRVLSGNHDVAGTPGEFLQQLDVLLSTRLASAGYQTPLSAASTRLALGLATANLDTQLSALVKLLAAVYDSASVDGNDVTLSNGAVQTITNAGRVTVEP